MPNKKHPLQKDTGRVGYTDFFGLWDIIAVSGKRVRFVQVKSNENARGEWYERARAWKCPKDCTKEVWIFKDRVKDPKIILL